MRKNLVFLVLSQRTGGFRRCCRLQFVSAATVQCFKRFILDILELENVSFPAL